MGVDQSLEKSVDIQEATKIIQDKHHYYDDIDIFDYDETIVAHPYMDALKAAIVAHVTMLHTSKNRPVSVLDAGCGSGQLSRALLGLNFVRMSACDVDPHANKFFTSHPETRGIDIALVDLTDIEAVRQMPHVDISILLGVFHHIPPNMRTNVLRNMSIVSDYVFVADEGILEYKTEIERRTNAKVWYNFIINEVRRRKIHKLADFEADFMRSDTATDRQLTDDFKESPFKIRAYATKAGLTLTGEVRIGPWELLKGGMYLSVFQK